MEVQRGREPSKGYLQAIRDLCNEHKIILIFDECTSGFRETFGGIHKSLELTQTWQCLGKP